jgi:outer membrane cobalamin receptor
LIIKIKLSAIFILFAVTISVSAQNVLDSKVLKSYTGYSIAESFKELEAQFGVKFFYKKNWIEKTTVPELPQALTLNEFITFSLDKNDLSFIELQGSNIVLVPRGYNSVIKNNEISLVKTIGNPLEKGKHQLNRVEGYVYYGKTQEPIIGAVVVSSKHNKQTITDYKGYYYFNLPGGNDILEFSFIGLEKNAIDIEVFSHGTLDCELYDSHIEIEAVNVSAYSGKRNIERTQMGVAHVEMKSLNKLPVLMGEPDVIKGMTLLPGVQSTGELASGFNVRGGNSDQNSVLINGAPMYNTSHLFGLFSTLIPDALNSVQFYKGTQSANFGSRLSSVMDIQLKKPDNNKVQGKAGIGILNSSAFVEGPIKKDFCAFSFGARTTYSNWLLKKIPDIDIRNSETQFYDLIGNLHFKLNKKNQLDLFAYYSADNFKYSDRNKYAYDSFISGLNYRWLISDIFSMSVNASYTQYKNDLTYTEDPAQASNVRTGINQLLAKTEFNLQLNKHNLLFGLEGSDYTLNGGDRNKYGIISQIIPEFIEPEKALELGGFIHDNVNITDKLSLMIGLRYSWYSKYGSSYSNIYDPSKPISANSIIDTLYYGNGEMVKPYAGLEPRVGIKYGLTNNSSIKAGFHISKQYQHLISNSSTSTPSDYWKSADMNIKPMKSQQLSLGYFHNFFNSVVETSVEIYYKQIDNLLDYRNGAILVMNSSIERDVLPGLGKAYGLELMVKKNAGKLNGWLSYTLSKSLIQIDSEFESNKINDGKFFPTYNDRLHDLSVSVNYQFTRRWNFAGNFILTSGRPATFPEKKYKIHSGEVVYFSERNKYRLSAYHRMDISVTYEGFLKKTKKVHPSFTFSVYNLYGRKNIYSVYYKNTIPSSQNDYTKYGLYKLSIIGIPIPSFTVNLRF